MEKLTTLAQILRCDIMRPARHPLLVDTGNRNYSRPLWPMQGKGAKILVADQRSLDAMRILSSFGAAEW